MAVSTAAGSSGSRTGTPLVRRLLVLAVGVLVSVAAGSGLGLWASARHSTSLANLMQLSPLPPHPAPGFRLVDQSGRAVSLQALRGHPVVLNFFDDMCTDVCPLVAQEMLNAAHDLGARAARDVSFVAVNVNAAHAGTRWVQAFTKEHGLGALPHWYFLTGTAAQLRPVWQAYDVSVQVDPKTRIVYHTDAMYFIGSHGVERWLAVPLAQLRANGAGYLPPADLAAWGRGIAARVRALQ